MVLFQIREKKGKELGKPPKQFDVLQIDRIVGGTYLICDIRTGDFKLILNYAELKNNYVREKRRSNF